MDNHGEVIRALEQHFNLFTYGSSECKDCQYYDLPGLECVRQLCADVVELLKGQETTLEKDGHHIRCLNCGEYWCDNDREGNPFPMNFCPNCGRKVKWNDYSGESYREA